MSTARTAPTSRRRPFALVALAGIMLLKAGLLVLLLAGAALYETRLGGALEFGNVLDEQLLIVAVFGALVAGLLIVSAVGLLAYRRIGWLVAMLTTGIFIAFDIIAFLNGSANYLWMVLNIVTVFYLNQRDVRISVGALGAAGEAGPERVA